MDMNSLIIEILERVKGLEVTLKDYPEVEDNSEEAKAIALKAKEEVEELIKDLEAKNFQTTDSKKWSKRTVIAAFISMALMLLGNIIFVLLKLKFNW